MDDFTLTIETGNEAMKAPDDFAEALRNVAERLEAGEVAGTIQDGNGNTVGKWVAPVTLYSVCVNAAGCLPDSETYPFTVSGLEEAQEALAIECRAGLLNGEYGGDDVETTARCDEAIEEGSEALERGDDVLVPLDGTYRLSIERKR